MDAIDKIALVLVIAGALNWLLVGVADFDVVAQIFGGTMTTASRVVYIIVGLAGIWAIRLFSKPRVDIKS